jgi:hypothetical protein
MQQLHKGHFGMLHQEKPGNPVFNLRTVDAVELSKAWLFEVDILLQKLLDVVRLQVRVDLYETSKTFRSQAYEFLIYSYNDSIVVG